MNFAWIDWVLLAVIAAMAFSAAWSAWQDRKYERRVWAAMRRRLDELEAAEREHDG